MGADPYAPFVSRVSANWPSAGRHQTIEGTLVFADVSGFTALSERLAKRGKVGAELLTDLLDAVFDGLLDVALARGGDLLAFGGDALCLLFTDDGHPDRAADTAIQLHRRLRHHTAAHAAIGRVSLGMSIGAETGELHLVRAGTVPYEQLVLGPTVTATLGFEGIAVRGEIIVGPELARRLPGAGIEVDPVTGTARLRHAPTMEPSSQVPMGRTSEDLIPTWLQRVIAGGAEAEHRAATVGFVKLQGTDALVADPGTGISVADHVITALQAIALRFGVTVLAPDVYPDAVKVLMATGVPTASTDDAERMIEAARAIVAIDTPLAIHVGVNSGRVFSGTIGSSRRRTYTVMGDAVNLAARLMARADAGTIVATDATLDGARRSYVRRPLEPFMVKGKSRPITASEVGAATTSTPMLNSAIVGRASELAALTDAWERAQHGTGGSIEIIGPAGMGKSTLLSAFRSNIAAPSVFAIEGGLYSRGSPYRALIPPLLARVGIDESLPEAEQGRLFVERVAAIDPDLVAWTPLLAIPFGIELIPTPETAAIAPQFRRPRLGELFLELMVALARGPMLLLIEDAHWIDEASAELLQGILRAAPDRPWLVLVTRRPTGEGPSFDGISRTISLGPLDEASARALAVDVMSVTIPEPTVQALIARAEGNPLLLAELTRAAAAGRSIDELPESVESLASSEIDTLAPADRRVLRRAAVLGAAFPAEMLEGLAGTEYRGLTTLDRFLVEDGDRIRFRHALLRDAAYEGLTYRERARLHHETAERIERDSGHLANEQAELLSLHHFHAHNWEPALRFSTIAADRARSDLAPIEAAGFFRRALAAARHCSTPAAPRAILEESLAEMLERSGLYAEARAALRRARRLTKDPLTTTRLLLADGRIEECMGRYSHALGHYTRADRALASCRDPAAVQSIQAQLAIERAGIRYRQGQYRKCAEILQAEIIGGALAHASDAQLGRAHYLLDSALSDLGEAAGHEHARRAIELLQQAGDLGGEASVWNNLGVEAYEVEHDFDAALEHYARCERLSQQVGDVVQVATARNNMGEILSDQFAFEEAEAAFEHARRVFQGAGYKMGAAVATSNLGQLAIRQGEPDRAGLLLDEASAILTTIGAAPFARQVDCHRAERLLALNEPLAALTLIEATIVAAELAGERAVLGEWLAALATSARDQITASTQADRKSTGESAVTRHGCAGH